MAFLLPRWRTHIAQRPSTCPQNLSQQLRCHGFWLQQRPLTASNTSVKERCATNAPATLLQDQLQRREVLIDMSHASAPGVLELRGLVPPRRRRVRRASRRSHAPSLDSRRPRPDSGRGESLRVRQPFVMQGVLAGDEDERSGETVEVGCAQRRDTRVVRIRPDREIVRPRPFEGGFVEEVRIAGLGKGARA